MKIHIVLFNSLLLTHFYYSSFSLIRSIDPFMSDKQDFSVFQQTTHPTCNGEVIKTVKKWIVTICFTIYDIMQKLLDDLQNCDNWHGYGNPLSKPPKSAGNIDSEREPKISFALTVDRVYSTPEEGGTRCFLSEGRGE